MKAKRAENIPVLSGRLATDKLSVKLCSQIVSSFIPFSFNWALSSIPYISFQVALTFQTLFIRCLLWPLLNCVLSMPLAFATASIPNILLPVQWFHTILSLVIVSSTRLNLKSFYALSLFQSLCNSSSPLLALSNAHSWPSESLLP